MKVLDKTDPEVARIIRAEQRRQDNTLEMIASENHVSPAVLEAMGTVLTDKYAEGYPGKRYYCGNENMDAIEQLAIDRAKKVFGCEHANVQPHSGTSANIAVYVSALKLGDKIMGMDYAHGGHLSHGLPINISGMLYKSRSYGVDADSEILDMDHVRDIALTERPDIIVCGASAYPRIIDFEAFGKIAEEVGCPLMADIAHIAGLVIANVHPSPVPYSAFVTTTNHKTLRGPRGGMILCRSEWAKKIDAAVFPGIQGGPIMQNIAAKAVALGECAKPEFKDYAQQVVTNAKALAEALMEKGWRLVSGGTDNHLLLIDLRSRLPETAGKDAAIQLAKAGIISNWNSIPNDPRPATKTSGIRLGTPALTARGMDTEHIKQIAGWIDEILGSGGDEQVINKIRGLVGELCGQFPIPSNGN
ncbi:MAG: serine hydroxymethyltransferase [Planctomycetota bacterium]|jgi:glycine hydroxymethyltransferase